MSYSRSLAGSWIICVLYTSDFLNTAFSKSWIIMQKNHLAAQIKENTRMEIITEAGTGVRFYTTGLFTCSLRTLGRGDVLHLIRVGDC